MKPPILPALEVDLLDQFYSSWSKNPTQRRHVTVLFTDLHGYTEAASRLDNEVLYELIQQYIRLLVKEVYQFEGVVDKLTGDGLMALFGAPVAHENNAERAVRSALAMQASVAEWSSNVFKHLGIHLDMRVGLHTGPVIVGGLGSEVLVEYTAIGETVNLAQRIEEAAYPGAIFASETVYQQTRNLFDFETRSDVHLKGIDLAVTCYQVLGVRKRKVPAEPCGGFQARMTARDGEFQHLLKAFDDLKNKRKGAFILVRGEAGIGKSRLLREFQEAIRNEELSILQGRSLTYRRSVSHWIIYELLHSSLGEPPASPAASLRQRLADNAHSRLKENANKILPYLEHFWGLPVSSPESASVLEQLDPGTLKIQVFEAVSDFLLAQADHKPLVIVLEDLHWADEASLSMLQYLLGKMSATPFLLVGAARSTQDGGMEKLCSWAESALPENFHNLQLASLDTNQSTTLLANLLPETHFPAAILNQILERAAGIPLFLEEVLRMLMDTGILYSQQGSWRIMEDIPGSELGVPVSLHGLMLARFDQLPDQQRRLLQIASTIGHFFSPQILARVAANIPQSELQEALGILEKREFIRAAANSPQGSYAFQHVMVSETIYSTMLKRDRSQLHALVGEAIETLYADRLNDYVELLARHYAWSPNLYKGLHYLILAGKKAVANGLTEQARKNFEHALALLPVVDHSAEQVYSIHTGLGDVLHAMNREHEARDHYLLALKAISNPTHPRFARERDFLLEKIKPW